MKRAFAFVNLLCAVVIGFGGMAVAVEPGEKLADPALEQRARAISSELRCLVCQNQSIDDSDAELARDLRILVRERLTAGESNDEVITYLVSRYGEFILLRPQLSVRNGLLWGTPLLLLLTAAGYLWRARTASHPPAANPLDEAENQAIARILSQDG